MDDPGLDPAEHFRALNALSRVHRLTGMARRLWHAIRSSLKDSGQTSARIVDVGCGDGYLLLKLYELAKRDGFQLQLVGCDFSARALEAASERAATEYGTQLESCELDVLSDRAIPEGDVVMASLFLHHFKVPEVTKILQKMHASARQLLLVEDLLRTPLGYGLCWIGVHALTRSHVVHTDGLLSVRAGFLMDEMRRMMVEAGLDPLQSSKTLTRHWPERLLIRYPTR